MHEGIHSISSLLWGSIQRGPGLALKAGQVLYGTALEVNADRALLLLQGLNVVAELETHVDPGENIALRVEALNAEGKILLKKIDWAGNKQNVDQQGLQAVLRHFGLQQGKLNQTLLTQVFQNKLPVSRQHLQHLAGFAAEKNLTPQQVPALVWLWSKNLPLSKEAVVSTCRLMENWPDKSALKDFLGVFAENQKETVKINYRDFTQIIKNLLFKSSATTETIAAKLSTATENIGLNHERSLLQSGNSKENPGYEEAGNFPAEKTIKTSLKYALLKLVSAPETKQAAFPGEQALKMLEEITGLQLLNVSGRQDTAESSSIFLANWVASPDKKLLPLFMKIKKYSSNPENAEGPLYQIFFLLNTRHLGQVICRLGLGKEHLTCSFTVKGRDEKRLIDNNMELLRHKLAQLPWQVVIFPTKVSSAAKIKHTWREEFFAGSPGKVRILDARA